jgi:hypothetical protein
MVNAIGHLWGPGAASLRLFLLYQQISMTFMLAAHRWSHSLPEHLPWIVLQGQKMGVFVSPEAHSQHHAYYNLNFAILSGITDPFLNYMTGYLSVFSAAWGIVFLLYALLPCVVSYLPFCPFAGPEKQNKVKPKTR